MLHDLEDEQPTRRGRQVFKLSEERRTEIALIIRRRRYLAKRLDEIRDEFERVKVDYSQRIRANIEEQKDTPSLRELARIYQVSVPTVMTALRWFEKARGLRK